MGKSQWDTCASQWDSKRISVGFRAQRSGIWVHLSWKLVHLSGIPARDMSTSHMIGRLLVLSKSRKNHLNSKNAKMMFALKGAPLSTRIRYHRFGHIACETYKIHKNLSTPPLGKQDGRFSAIPPCLLLIYMSSRYLEDFLKRSI